MNTFSMVTTSENYPILIATLTSTYGLHLVRIHIIIKQSIPLAIVRY